MAFLWCLVVVSLAALAQSSLAANTVTRELAELLQAMKEEVGHYTINNADGTPPISTAPEDRDDPPISADPEGKQSMPPNERDDSSMPPNERNDEQDFSNLLPDVAKENAEQQIDKEYHSGPTPAEVAKMVQQKKRAAAMSKADIEVNLKKIAQDYEKQDFNWALKKAVKEMKKTKGENYYREFQRSTRTRNKDGSKSMYVCYFCDNNCANASSSYGSVANLESGIASPFLKINFDVKNGLIVYPGVAVQYAAYLEGTVTDRGVNDLTRASSNFWKQDDLYVEAREAGCDISVLYVATDDSLFTYIPNTRGVSNMMQVCLQNFALVAVSTQPTTTTAFVAHELGHLLGMYHDQGRTNVAYTDPETVAYLREHGAGDAYDALVAACDREDSGCSDGNYRCVMSPSVDSSHTTLSDCSVNYEKLLEVWAVLIPRDYDISCLN